MPKKNEPYKVGDRVQISLNNQIMDAVIRANLSVGTVDECVGPILVAAGAAAA
jgi:hypothetical protein